MPPLNFFPGSTTEFTLLFIGESGSNIILLSTLIHLIMSTNFSIDSDGDLEYGSLPEIEVFGAWVGLETRDSGKVVPCSEKTPKHAI